MTSNAASFLSLVNSPVKFRLFLFSRLPAAYISGVRVRYADENKCVVTVPFKWLSQNPFKSTYFACLSMAAEMSTGVLALAHIYTRNPPVSMLVLEVKGNFMKKAVGRTTFTCEDGPLIRQTIEDAINSKESRTVTAGSVGKDSDGNLVAEFSITWALRLNHKLPQSL